MPMIQFDGEDLQVPEPNDLSVALTEWELLQLLSDLPGTGALPVAVRSRPGYPKPVLVIVPRMTDLPAVVALARLRKAVSGPVDQEEAVDGAQEPVSVMDSPPPSLRSALRDGYLTQRDKVEKFVAGALEGRPLSTQRVMEALDEVLAR